VEQRLTIALVRNKELRCNWCCNGFQFHSLCEAQNCVVTVGGTAFKYACCAKHRIASSLLLRRLSITHVVRSTELRCHWWNNGFQLHFLGEAQNCVVTGDATAFNYTSFAKHRFALPLVEQRHSITLTVRNSELLCHWCSNGIKLHVLCETQNCVVTGVPTAYNYTCFAKQNCVVTGAATAFNYTCCAKHEIAL